MNSEILKREFQKINVNYAHKPELGVIYQIRTSYIERYIDDIALNGYYNWHLKDIDFNIQETVEFLKKKWSLLIYVDG